MDLTLATLAAMCHQEETCYAVVDYPKQQQQEGQHQQLHHKLPAHLAEAQPNMVDEDCRTKMASWCYQVVDFCQFQRETVAMAMNMLDRYAVTPEGQDALLHRNVYQLAAMTCLYTAVKIHEPQAMDPNLVSNLSRGAYRPQQIEDMEARILMALQWRVNPPTAMAFVRHFLDLLPDNNVTTEKLRQTVYDLTKYQTELAIPEHDFITIPASTIAFCSLMNALESVGLDDPTLRQIGTTVSESIGLYHDDSMLEIQNWLYETVARQPAALVKGKIHHNLQPPSGAMHHNNDDNAARPSRPSFFGEDVSPRSISIMP